MDLHFIWLCDCSGSMVGDKINSLNQAIKDCITPMRQFAEENPDLQILVRVIQFGNNGASWHIEQPQQINEFEWKDLSARTGNLTPMGHAIRLLAQAFDSAKLAQDNMYRPIFVLISDGEPTDNFSIGLDELMEQEWGRNSSRYAIAIGDDADKETLTRFIGNFNTSVLSCSQSSDLPNLILNEYIHFLNEPVWQVNN